MPNLIASGKPIGDAGDQLAVTPIINNSGVVKHISLFLMADTPCDVVIGTIGDTPTSREQAMSAIVPFMVDADYNPSMLIMPGRTEIILSSTIAFVPAAIALYVTPLGEQTREMFVQAIIDHSVE